MNKHMSERALVIGGAGFIGRHLVPLLAQLHKDVLIADNLHPQIHDKGCPEWLAPYSFAGCDIRDVDSLLAVFRWFRPTIVFALAAETGTGQSLDAPASHCSTNVTGLANVLECITKSASPVKRVVLPSSRAVYGEGAWTDHAGEIFYPTARTRQDLERGAWSPWIQEPGDARPVPHLASAHWPRPVNVYGATKLAQEQVLTTWALGHGVEPSILRLQNVYGPGQAAGNPYTGVLVHFVSEARAGRQIPVYEDGNIVRDFVHVSDVARALADSAALPRGTGVLDIGSGTGTSIFELAGAVAAAAGGPPPKVTGQYRVGDVRAASADVGRARQVMGFETRMGLREGLIDLLSSSGMS